MFFLLKNTLTGENVHLTKQKEYVVGRKHGDILLENDQSISRKHAVIRVKDHYVTLQDCKSKYHTLHNGVEVNPQVEIKLKHMDLIQFGVFNSKFCFEAYEFVTAASALSTDKKLALKENVAKCNGKFVDKWSSSCTHLTVDKITLTIKVLQALIDEKHVVTPEYWGNYAQSIENKTAPPDINEYNKPPVAEQLLRSDFQYKLDSKRKTLFENKMFVFLQSNTRKQMEEVIKGCGGNCMAWDEEGPITFYEISKSPKEHLFVKTDNDEKNVSFDAVIKDMVKQNKRAIPLNEIALAIVHCSCEVNCNPNFNKVTEVFGLRTQKYQTMRILAAETQSENMVSVEIKTEKVIPPSVEDDWLSRVPASKESHGEMARQSGVKRSSEKQDNDRVFSKKPKIEEEENKKKQDVLHTVENDKAKDNFMKGKPHASQKRKAAEELQESDAKTLNPFSSITVAKNKRNKTGDEQNPFELTRRPSKPSLSKNSPSKYENPFARIPTLIKSTNNVTIGEESFLPKQESKKEIKLIPKKSDESIGSSIKRSLLNTTWMSKNTSVVKTEVKEEDPELLKIAEAFKDCVKVEILSVYNRKENSENIFNDTSRDSTDGKKSFKKFRKIKPIKPQVTIIPRSRFIEIALGDATGIEVCDLNDSDNEAGPRNVSHARPFPKQRVKKFIL